MATFYAKQFVGVKDGTKNPPDRADGRQVGAKKSAIIATKDNTNALANTDKVYVGTLRQGELMTRFGVLSDTSFGAVTISVGTLALPTKYVNAQLMTAVNIPTAIGPLASAVAGGPLAADEDLYVTVSGAVAAVVVAHFLTEFCSVK